MKHPDQFLQLAKLVGRYKVMNKAFHVDKDNVSSYMATLEAMIVNQTSLEDIKKIRVPIHLMKGAIDPLIVTSYYSQLQKERKNVTLQTVPAGHEVIGPYAKAVARYVSKLFPADEKH